MTSKWQIVTTPEVCENKKSSMSTGPFGSSISSKFFVDEGVPVIRGSNLSQDTGIKLINKNLVFITEKKAAEFERSTVTPGDLVFTCWGTIDQVGLIEESSPFAKYVISNKQMKMTPDPYKADSRFLYYQFSSPRIKNWILDNGIGSSVPGFNLGMLKEIEIDLPSLNEQKAIAHVLGALDNKIELNQKMNQTLENIARAIFKSWFVDFDPVRAKMEGRPTGLPPEIDELFPNELVDSEIGEVPKGWKVKSADSLFNITIGRTPPRKESQWFSESENDVPWVSIRDMGDCGVFVNKTNEYLTHEAVNKHRMNILPVGTALVSFKLTVGRVSITTKDMTTNEAIAHFPPSTVFAYPHFTYFYLNGFRYDSLGSTSSIATAVNSKMIKAIPFLVPSSKLTANFEEIVTPMIDRIRVASEEIQVLSELRDTLLPKLISGELRIPDAEKFLEEAGI